MEPRAQSNAVGKVRQSRQRARRQMSQRHRRRKVCHRLFLTSDPENEPSYRSSQEISVDDGPGRIWHTRGAQQEEEATGDAEEEKVQGADKEEQPVGNMEDIEMGDDGTAEATGTSKAPHRERALDYPA